MDPAGPALDLVVPLEIIIGTIPLQNIQHVFAQTGYNSETYAPSAPPMPALPSITPSAPDARMYDW